MTPTNKSLIDMKSAQKIYYPGINVRIRRDDDGLYDSIVEAAKDAGISLPEYMKTAAREKLIRDGYILK